MMEPGKRSSRRSVEVEVVVDCGVRRRRAQGDAVDIEAGMAAFEARVAALNSQIEGSAEQRPSTSYPSV